MHPEPSPAASGPPPPPRPEKKLADVLVERDHLIRSEQWPLLLAVAHGKLASSHETRIHYHTAALVESAVRKARKAALGKVKSPTLHRELKSSDPKEALAAEEELRRAFETLAYLGTLPLLGGGWWRRSPARPLPLAQPGQAASAADSVSAEAESLEATPQQAPAERGFLRYLRQTMVSVLNDARRKRAAEGRRTDEFAEAETAEFMADNVGALLPADIRASDRATKGRAIATFLREFCEAHPAEGELLLAYGALKHGERGVNVDAPELEAVYEHLAKSGIGRWDAESRIYYGVATVEDLAVAFGKGEIKSKSPARPDESPEDKRKREQEARRKAGLRLVAEHQALLAPFLRARGILPSGHTNPPSTA